MSKTDIIPIVLLCALPASGKSESRAFLRSLPVEQSRAEFKIGFPTIQLDDYPYVELLKFIDKDLQSQGFERPFYYSEYYTFINPYTWGVLIDMLNEDYHALISKQIFTTSNPTKWICDRFVSIFEKRGCGNPFAKIPSNAMELMYDHLNVHCRKMIDARNQSIQSYTPDRTIIIEFARGGGCGYQRHPDFFPLPEPFGYQYSLAQFCPEILSSCAMLYIKVTPEQSFQKNLSRAPPPGWTGSTDIFHCVPDCVMFCDYGCDDVDYLLKISDIPNTITIGDYHIPVGVFDNTEDLTTFCRGDPKDWPKESIEKIHKAMTAAFVGLLAQWQSIRLKRSS